MRKAILAPGALIFAFAVSGCGGESHETHVKDLLEILQRTQAILKSITNAKTAEEKAPALKEEGEKLRSLEARALTLTESLSGGEKARLAEDYKEKLSTAVTDVAREWERVKKIKGAREALESQQALVPWIYTQQ